MRWQVDPSAAAPLYEQVASSVRAEMVAGRLDRGDRLPSAKLVAASLDINLHTVLRAYQQLRDEGLIELRRGRGAVVTADQPAGLARLSELVGQLRVEGARLGLSAADLARLIEEEPR
ncbi:GntR family transcriptional regulator [Ornithinicoccus hortensis]|uniref:DNA-binding transcriptional regulator YhcF (GntR family) n=1 Tax=Ornithinicoccus hortensis TaxID=82346 RepID=A0A542YNA1_9MICO|nr:GntR family transcriptional regulator [Ornithinicoccus hortensis]TQL49578.1 DNA-binding transcriptional regulator YhcF (GntR family) [Ornithinicoccus hortensis]